MRITLTGPNDTIWTQEVSGELDLATLKMLSAVDLGLDFNTMIILRNGQPMTSDSMNLDSAGVKDGDILMALPGNLFNRQRPAETGGARATVGFHLNPIFLTFLLRTCMCKIYDKAYNLIQVKSEEAILRTNQLA